MPPASTPTTGGVAPPPRPNSAQGGKKTAPGTSSSPSPSSSFPAENDSNNDATSSSPKASASSSSSIPNRPFNSDVKDPLLQRKMREENEFIWANFGEPHAERRKRILAKYGKEIKKLMGVVEWKTKYICFAVVVTQMIFSYTLPNYFLGHVLHSFGIRYGGGNPNLLDWAALKYFNIDLSAVPEDNPYDAATAAGVDYAVAFPWYSTWLPILAFAWLIGGALTQNMFLAIHEVSHHTAFKKPFYNDLLCMWCNFVVAVPFAMMFKTYHQEHHRYLGWEGVDTDLPEHVEAWLLRSFPGKVFFLFAQTLFYALRPMISRAPPLAAIHYMNWIVMVLWWVGQYFVFGWHRFLVSWLYCLYSSLSTGMFHPTSGHFISEHYVFNPDTFQETFSYYGLGNIIGWNVGYHNEHHDFPSVPWSLLPKVKAIAPEFYEPLECTSSWTMTLVNFLSNSGVSEFSRVKRERGAGRRKGALLPTTPENNHTPTADPAAMRKQLDALAKEYPFDSNNKTLLKKNQ